MYKNQLQELAQRSCFNLPAYTCIREGPDHAPRFKATVSFNGEIFESPNFCTTLRQAEHAAAEVALHSLSSRGPSHSLAARILDETGVYKNLLQEIAQRVGAPLPQYSTYRSGLGHLHFFTGRVELAGVIFTGESAKNKKQAEKNAAMAAWYSLKQLAKESASSSSESENFNDELEQISISRALLNYRMKEKAGKPSNAPLYFPKKGSVNSSKPSSPQPQISTTSKILQLIYPKSSHRSRRKASLNPKETLKSKEIPNPKETPVGKPSQPTKMDDTCEAPPPQRHPVASAAPYIPIRHLSPPYPGLPPPVTIRTSVPVFSSPPFPSMHASRRNIAPPVCIRQAVPVFAAPPVGKDPKTATVSSLPAESPGGSETTSKERPLPSIERLKI